MDAKLIKNLSRKVCRFSTTWASKGQLLSEIQELESSVGWAGSTLVFLKTTLRSNTWLIQEKLHNALLSNGEVNWILLSIVYRSWNSSKMRKQMQSSGLRKNPNHLTRSIEFKAHKSFACRFWLMSWSLNKPNRSVTKLQGAIICSSKKVLRSLGFFTMF